MALKKPTNTAAAPWEDVTDFGETEAAAAPASRSRLFNSVMEVLPV